MTLTMALLLEGDSNGKGRAIAGFEAQGATDGLHALGQPLQAKAVVAAVAERLHYTVPIIHDVQGDCILKKAERDHGARGVRMLNHIIKAFLRGTHDHLLDIGGHDFATGNDKFKGGIPAQSLRSPAHLRQDGIQLGF
jgi:hypothetical protein